jgi:transcriptional regulator with XRE-family HTH domain
MAKYRPAKNRISVSVGQSVRIIRELQELSQNQLSNLTRIPQTTISAIEIDRVRLGIERAKVLCQALKCHPGVLVFPGWKLPMKQWHNGLLRRPSVPARFVAFTPMPDGYSGRQLRYIVGEQIASVLTRCHGGTGERVSIH